MISLYLVVIMLNGPVLSVDAQTAPMHKMSVSWYALDGKTMANGEIFHSSDLTLAAHKHYPFGTKLRVLNPKNGRSLVVEVTDRGPFIKGRDLDVSESAAEWLGIKDKGVATLDVIVISNKALSA